MTFFSMLMKMMGRAGRSLSESPPLYLRFASLFSAIQFHGSGCSEKIKPGTPYILMYSRMFPPPEFPLQYDECPKFTPNLQVNSDSPHTTEGPLGPD